MTDTSPTLTDADRAAITTARALAMDAVQNAGSGHPGTAMALAPLAHLLFQRHIRHDPAQPDWEGRDRFVLSCGHVSILLYTQLHLTGYDVTLDDLKQFRSLGSRTPGHPEYGQTAGVETTTGPLGQGLATAVGMAMGFARQRGVYDADAAPGQSPFDRNVWVVCSDGDLQEGLSYEAAALAGHHKLGQLVVVFDDNRIQIEGSTELAAGEDMAARFESQGWGVRSVGLSADGDIDTAALEGALAAAKAETDRPSLVILRSTIGWPAPHASNTAGSHGAPLGADEVAATKVILGIDPATSFVVSEEVYAHTRQALERGQELRKNWEVRAGHWSEHAPEQAAAWWRARDHELPSDIATALPSFEAGASVATRDASSKSIQALAAQLPQMWGGSADLGDSNKTTISGGGSFLPGGEGSRAGRVVHWGVREHAMAAALNGITLAGGSIAFAGTFLAFCDYQRPSIRLASLMALPVTYVWTHDSVALGADGPTHQPIEHLASLRAMPGFQVVRPADARETAAAWLIAVQKRTAPLGLVLARQSVPVLDVEPDVVLAGVRAGAYVVHQGSSEEPDLVIVASGSEVATAMAAATELEAMNCRVRVVSMPCREWHMAHTPEERDAVIPRNRPTVVVEAASSFGWSDVVGTGAVFVTIDRFGTSASADDALREMGITTEAVTEAALRALVAGSLATV